MLNLYLFIYLFFSSARIRMTRVRKSRICETLVG